MAGAIKDNIPDGSKIALVNTMALLSRDPRSRHRSPHHAKNRRDSSASPHGSRTSNNRSGSTSISFHINSPGKSVFLLDTGAQRSCIGKCTFVEMGGSLKSLNKSENSFIFGDGPLRLLVEQRLIFWVTFLALILCHVIFLA